MVIKTLYQHTDWALLTFARFTCITPFNVTWLYLFRDVSNRTYPRFYYRWDLFYYSIDESYYKYRCYAWRLVALPFRLLTYSRYWKYLLPFVFPLPLQDLVLVCGSSQSFLIISSSTPYFSIVLDWRPARDFLFFHPSVLPGCKT